MPFHGACESVVVVNPRPGQLRGREQRAGMAFRLVRRPVQRHRGRGGVHPDPKRPVRRQPAQQGRGEVVVGVDEPWQDRASGGVEHGIADGQPGRTLPNGGNPVILDHDVAASVNGAALVHRHDQAVVDHRSSPFHLPGQ
jgi:hypothetical protein